MAYVQVGGKQYISEPSHGCTLVDPDYVPILNTCKLYWSTKGYCKIALPGTDGRHVQERLHRFLFEKAHNTVIPDKMVIHHINSKKWDNRIENLELTTTAHNSAAIQKKEGQSSIYKGVVYCNRSKKWKSKIKCKYKNYGLGYFDKETDAARAYDQSFIAIHGSENGSNNILTQDEIAYIATHRDEFLPRPKLSNRSFPQYIEFTGKSYRVRINRNALSVSKCFSTLDDAVSFRDSTIQAYETKKQQDIRDKPILRDNSGIAIIPVKLPKKDEVIFSRVSDEDYYNVLQFKWYLSQGYAWSNLGWLHRYILNNTDSNKVIDHINRDKLDNRRENLRTVSYSLNNRNKRKRDGTSSQYQGVAFRVRTKKWQAQIKINSKTVHLGTFKSEEEAYQRYLEEYRKLEALEINN